jgi:transposase
VPHSMCGSGARWCARADAIFDVPDMHVLDVEIDDQQRLVLTIESGQLEAACPACGVLAAGHGRRLRRLHDVPCFGRVTLLRWLVRMWRCREPTYPTTTFSEAHDVAPPRMVLTTRAVAWATSALSYDDTTVSALARHLGVDWHTAWDAIEVEAKARTSDPDRLKGVRTSGSMSIFGGRRGSGSTERSPSWWIFPVTRPDACMPGCWMRSWAAYLPDPRVL